MPHVCASEPTRSAAQQCESSSSSPRVSSKSSPIPLSATLRRRVKEHDPHRQGTNRSLHPGGQDPAVLICDVTGGGYPTSRDALQVALGASAMTRGICFRSEVVDRRTSGRG